MSLDELLAHCCAPALAGIKSANLVACHRNKYPNIEEDVKNLNIKLNNSGIFFETLISDENKVLLFVYREKSLNKTLSKSDVRSFLKENGYPSDGKSFLEHLKYRFICGSSVPHEIGVFLDYPIEDIRGFLENKGERCKLCGYWKVYSDEENAKKLFDRYTKCRNAVCKRVTNGSTITSLFCV